MIVTVEQDASVPRVKIETASTDVYRTIGPTTVRVRGVVEAGVIYDYELPQATEATYVDGFEVSDPVQMPDVGCWLIPPGSPEDGCRVTFTNEGLSNIAPVRDVATIDIPGRDGSFSVDFGRRGRRGSIGFYVQGPWVDRAERCLSAGTPHFLSRPPSVWPLLHVSDYVAITEESPTPIGQGAAARWVYEVSFIPTDRPTYVVSSTVTIGTLTGTIGSLSGTIGDLGG